VKGWALRPLCPGDARERPAIERDNGQAFRQLNPGVVGLAGLEPAPSSLSEIDGEAPCYPAFPQFALIREWYKDGVNRSSLPGGSSAASPG
jgi:hypothetical protein